MPFRAPMVVSRVHPAAAHEVAGLAAATGFRLDLQSELSHDFAELWVEGEIPSSPDAFLLFWRAADELHIIAIGTRPECRRAGLARSLLERLVQTGREIGLRLVLLEVRRSNEAALGLYRSLGFTLARVRRSYYENPCEDGLELMLELASDPHLVTQETPRT
jgi:[ribosomal protein S18]-alanine N-acetyltransferase